MRLRPILWLLVSVACFVGAVYFWRLGNEWQARKAGRSAVETPVGAAPAAKPVRIGILPATTSSAELFVPSLRSTNASFADSRTNLQVKYRLANTTKSAGELSRDPMGILLANALIDLRMPLALEIPDSLRAGEEPGAFIVQSRGPITDAFRAQLQASGATVISYIPNNAYLVRADQSAAQQLRGSGTVQAVLPYEPYYKLDVRLLDTLFGAQPALMPEALNVVVYSDAVQSTLKALTDMGATVLAQSPSPFGVQLRVQNAYDLAAVANLPGVGNVEGYTPRRPANDLARQRVGIASSTTNPVNYLGLSGSNIMMGVFDSGVNGSHPDLLGRVFGPASTTDPDGHGTHVAGIMAGNGSESLSVSNASESFLPPVDGQFRGMAPLAKLFAMPYNSFYSDFDLQEAAARTNASIVNNSWGYGETAYDQSSASFDAAVRDSLPGMTGSQPVMYVFSAGNDGGGDDNGLGGRPQSVESPGNAKNVITVGAIESFRNLTNEVISSDETNAVWEAETDSQDQVAAFSARGNIGIGVEGDFGRFKPDVVAPGVFVVSARSPDWDEGSYYNPTTTQTTVIRDEVVDPDQLYTDSFYVPEDAIEVVVRVFDTRPHVEEMPIYVKMNDFPTTADPSGINEVRLPGTAPLITDANWYFAVGNPTNVPVEFDYSVTIRSTNQMGDYYTVLSNMNSQLGEYRYESGTSMAAPVVSGTLALLADYFTNQLRLPPPSPALMKAMLINGARPVNSIYDLEVKKEGSDPRNYQGWGLINLTNSVPSGLKTNDAAGAITQLTNGPSPMLIFEQSPSNALATADQRVINVTVATNAAVQTLRVTLVWTDPPGNPAAGIKLVNDLDLVVTNLDTKAVYYGNSFPVGGNFSLAASTNEAPESDVVNNVENVYIAQPLSTNYAIAVIGRAVNVNAVTAHTNKVAQDYALVVSVGNGTVSNALTIAAGSASSTFAYTNVTYMTNQFGTNSADGNQITGGMLMNQHVGANSPLLGDGEVPLRGDTVWGPLATDGRIYLGTTNQWHFYVLTNTMGFTNAAFLTFLPPTLAVPRMGVTNYDNTDESSRIEGDIDIYVSTDSRLLQLDRSVIDGSFKALSRNGTEVVSLTNAVSGAYYVGIHAPDRQAAEYAFFGGFSLFPFSEDDGTGVTMRAINVPMEIPSGPPEAPGVARIISICVQPISIRRVIVTNLSITHENLGDLIGTLTHNRQFAVLHNHRSADGAVDFKFLFEDNGENYPPDAEPTDGPGSLRDFVGDRGEGLWLLTEIDDALQSTGRVNNLRIRLDRAFDEISGSVDLTIAPNSFGFTFFDVPPEATNFVISVGGNTLPLELYVRRDEFPTRTDYDYFWPVPPVAAGTTNTFRIDTNSTPPLQPGRYFLGLFNPNLVSQSVRVVMTVQPLDIRPVATIDFTEFGPQAILDDAVTFSTNSVPYDRRIARVDVGVAIQHPRISDLALTLLAPSGKRILLFENRGGQTADLGTVNVTTNFSGSVSSGDFAASTNTIPLSTPSGILVIDFEFYNAPDSIDVFYGATNIFSSGLINSNGTLTIPFGPGAETNLTILINKNNNPENPSTVWSYTPRIIMQEGTYFVFSENTNFARVPIKFAAPPFTASPVIRDGFEFATANANPTAPNFFSGWQVTAGNLDLLTSGTFGSSADTGTNYIDLNGTGTPATIVTNIATIPGRSYLVSFAYSKNPDTSASPSFETSIGGTNLTITVNKPGLSWSDLQWQQTSMVFTASSPISTLQVRGISGGSYGALVDSFVVESLDSRSNFPEETLQDLVGDNARGDWKLEVWDNRVGPAGTNSSAPILTAWELRFVFDRPIPDSQPLVHDVPVTNYIQACDMVVYSVAVPVWAQFATNTLISASLPVNIYFTTNTLPTTNDAAAALGVLTNVTVLSTTNGSVNLPQMVPGGTYYIGVENPCANATNVTVVYKVEFDITALQEGVAVTSTNLGDSMPRYFSYDVSTNATAVLFGLTNMSGNFDLVVRRGGPLPTIGNNQYGSFNPGTLDEEIIIFTNSFPVALTPGRWYLGVFNSSLASNVFTIVATEFTNFFGDIITLTNGIAYSNSAPAGAEQHYRYNVSRTAVRAQFEINGPSGDITLLASKGLPLPSPGIFDYQSANPFLNDELIVIRPDSTPVPITPGDWFLTAVNVSGGPVNYSIKATDWPISGQPIVVTGTDYVPPLGTDPAMFCITWGSLPGVHYHLESNDDLTTTNWVIASPTVTATGFTTTHCVPIHPGNRFFRVVEGLVVDYTPPPATLSLSAAPFAYGSTNGFLLSWAGSATSFYQVQWSTNLGLGAWTAFNPTSLTSTNMILPSAFTNGVYSFFDDATQLGGPPPPPSVFYRVLLLP